MTLFHREEILACPSAWCGNGHSKTPWGHAGSTAESTESGNRSGFGFRENVRTVRGNGEMSLSYRKNVRIAGAQYMMDVIVSGEKCQNRPIALRRS